jgi:hypothetical protein
MKQIPKTRKGERRIEQMKNRILWTLTVALLASFLLTALQPAYGPQPPEPSLLTQEELAFAEAVDGDYGYWLDERLAYHFGNAIDDQGREWFRNSGSPAQDRAAEWLASEMTNIGLKEVEKEPIPCHGWTFKGAYVQVVDPIVGPKWLAGGDAGIPGTVQSPNADLDGSITREIVYVGLGRKQDYEGKDVRGKLVLVDIVDEEMYWLNFPHMQAELEGAIGLVCHWIIPGYQDKPGSITTHDSEARPTIPAVNISNEDFEALIALMDTGPVQVKLWCDAEVTIPDTDWNIIGCLPGTKHPDELILFQCIYDTYWYGAVHHISTVAGMMTLAKALIDSGYEPDRTLVFIIAQEEFGWTDTINAWATGSHWLYHYNHTDWGGRTLARISVGDAVKGNYRVRLSGGPETYEWRQSILPLLDEFFTTHMPWSAYYMPPAETGLGYMPSTWGDTFSPISMGIPCMGGGGGGNNLYVDVYHVNLDTVDWVSGEAIAMNAITAGLNGIRLDHVLLAPYNFENLANLIRDSLDENALNGAGIQIGPITGAISHLRSTGKRVWDLIQSPKKTESADSVNALLMQTYKTIWSRLLIVGGWGDTSMFRHEQYQWDSLMLGEAIKALKVGQAADAMMSLRLVNGMWPAVNVDYGVFYHFMVEGTMPDNPNLMWGDQGREAYFTDVWHEYFSIQEKAAAGNADYSAEIASLQAKYETAVRNLEDSVDILLIALSEAYNLLVTVQGRLDGTHIKK